MAVIISKQLKIPKPFPKPSSHTPGDVITWDDKEWLVCHYDSSKNQVYLIAKDIISKTQFGDTDTYSGSTLASVAARYQSNNMSAAALAKCVDVTVNGVTSKVFVPSYEQMDGGFSWFNSDSHRIAYYNGPSYGNFTNYWTSSSPSAAVYPWYVDSDGRLSRNYLPNSSFGFRPCVCVQL